MIKSFSEIMYQMSYVETLNFHNFLDTTSHKNRNDAPRIPHFSKNNEKKFRIELLNSSQHKPA